MKLTRNWIAVNGDALAKCSEAHIAYLVKDAVRDIAALSNLNHDLLYALECLLSDSHSYESEGMARDHARKIVAKAKGE